MAPFSLAAYLRRVRLPAALADGRGATRELLATIMEAHSRAIPFENLDVVQKKPIDMSIDAVASKLVGDGTARRGGYCFETNVLLQAALLALHFDVEPLLCRVRWGKEPGVETPFTHLALRVRAADEQVFIADVGFAGTNSIAPLTVGVEEELPEGRFRTSDGVAPYVGYTTIQWCVKGSWRDLYVFRTREPANAADLSVANFWSHSSPTARFTGSFFVQRVVGETRCHILNDTYVVRRGHGEESVTTEERVRDAARLEELLETVFDILPPAGVVTAWEARFRGQ